MPPRAAARRSAAPPAATSAAPAVAAPPAALPAPLVEAVQGAVVDWFAQAQRRLPWRDGYDPYGVWVAEIMLQQTQVEAVRPYFARWLARFPDAAAVAAAPLEDVLKAWEGLGYYARARNLHRAAQALVAEHGGRLPDDLDALRALPGIGRYTAGAVRSIGFNRPAPIVDGNVGRVLGRLVALTVPARSASGQHRLWALAQALVPARGARDFNQGLMELGALVCRPTAPDCPACPLRPHCAAHATGTPTAFPPAAPRRERPLRSGALLLAVDGAGRVLLRRRPPSGIWGGLWEPPWLERAGAERPATTAQRLVTSLLPASRARLQTLGTVAHALTHFALELACYRSAPAAPGAGALSLPLPAPPHADAERDADAEAYLWADVAQIAALPLSRLAHKALALLAPATPAR